MLLPLFEKVERVDLSFDFNPYSSSNPRFFKSHPPPNVLISFHHSPLLSLCAWLYRHLLKHKPPNKGHLSWKKADSSYLNCLQLAKLQELRAYCLCQVSLYSNFPELNLKNNVNLLYRSERSGKHRIGPQNWYVQHQIVILFKNQYF